MLRTRFTRGFTRRVLCAALAASVAGPSGAQLAGMNVLHGQAVVTQAAGRTTVTTVNGLGTSHSAIDWRSFGVPTGATVFFSQPTVTSTSINRVLGGDPSNILGNLGSNGRLVLVNPAGIAIGPGAVVDTAGFTASTLAMSRSDAVAGRLLFSGDGGSEFEGKGDKQLEARGKVIARNGDVVLISREVEVEKGAIVEASGGDVVLAAGRTVELTGRGLEGIRMEIRSKDDKAKNLGTLRGDSVAIFAGTLEHSGLIQAQGVTVSGGRVVLRAQEHADIEGRIVAAGAQSGGSVHVTAEKLHLKSAASIDVSHLRGGGEILLGGGWQGSDPRVANARETEVGDGVQLRADAMLAGNGGTVVVWSEERTRFEGRISARGAGPGATGGRVEVSGRGKVEFKGKVDVGVDPKPKGVTVAQTQTSQEAGSPRQPGSSPEPGATAGAAPSGGEAPAQPASDTAGTQPATPPRRAPGAPFEPGTLTSVALVPMQGQPEPVQTAMREPVAQNVAFLDAAAKLAPLSSVVEDPYERKVVVTAVQCTVTR